MSELEPRLVESPLLLVPGTGELIDPTDLEQCVNALAEVREFEQRLREFKLAVTDAVIDHHQRYGKAIPLEDGRTVSLTAGEEVVYDAEQIELELREAGMPEQRIREVVVETVSYKVAAQQAKYAAAANPAYAEIIERHRQTVPKQRYVVIR